MKMKLILAACLVAAASWAQSEQWLEYHTSNDGRSFEPLHLTTNAPPNVALPKFNAPPYFARWKTPMDPAGERWLCLDRTRKSGPYDRLYIDSTGNGRLDDKTPIPARLESFFAYFPATPITFKGDDGPITYHLVLRFYQFEKSPPQLLAASGGWYEGMVDFGGVKKLLRLIDGNVNGTFNDMAANPFESDRVELDKDATGERYLGKLLEVDGKFFQIEVARDGAFVKVKQAENVVLGPVRVPENITEFGAFGENGYFERKPAKGQFTLPVGKYRMVKWDINRKDDKGTPWTLSGYNFPDTANFEVAADKAAALEIGEPVQAVLKANEQADHHITFDLNFTGRQKESIQLLRDGQRPRGPKLMLAAADGALCYTNTFEFG
jgi:hypothetical protein